MKKSKTDSFILTLPFAHIEQWQHDKLDKIFRVSGNICNNLIADRLTALRQIEQRKDWKQNQAEIAKVYREMEAELTGDQEKDKKIQAKYKKCFAPYYKVRSQMLNDNGFFEYAFHARVNKWRNHHKSLINSNVAQKLATQVWTKFNSYLFGNGKTIKFIPWTKFLSIEGKNNKTGIYYRNGNLIIAKMCLPLKFAKGPEHGNDESPSYVYEQSAMESRIKYCRIVRRWYPEGWRYFAQLILEGTHPKKVNPATGELLHPMGYGRVGCDIGTQTIAVCGDCAVDLAELAPDVQSIENELRLINRAMDRSRRVMNPEMFDADGEVIPVNKLPTHCVDKRGRRIWVNSKRYMQLAGLRRFLYRKQAALRVQQHNEFANRYLAYGDTCYIETMSFKGLAKRAKKQENIPPDEKPKCRKRFGKSIAKKAPALFVKVLERKMLDNGGNFYRINTWQAKASQYNHQTKAYKKKSLSKRWNIMPDGRKIQRDLYSAFLIQNTNDNLDGFIQELCDKKYHNFVALHDSVIMSLVGKHLPCSVGL